MRLSQSCLSSLPKCPRPFTYLPQCLPSPHPRSHFAPPANRGRYCGSPHKGRSVVLWGDSGSGYGEQNTCPLPIDDIVNVERYTPLQSVPSLCSTCTGSIVVVWLGPSTRLSDLSQPPKVRFGEWWTWWEPCPQTWVRASYIFQGQSNSHRRWVGVM